ncbi:hypothetical protein CWI59_06525, partial [Neisseria meningitidis]
KAFFSKPLQMPDSLDSRLRGNDGIGLLFSDGISAQSSSASTNARASNGRKSSMPSPTPI